MQSAPQYLYTWAGASFRSHARFSRRGHRRAQARYHIDRFLLVSQQRFRRACMPRGRLHLQMLHRAACRPTSPHELPVEVVRTAAGQGRVHLRSCSLSFQHLRQLARLKTAASHTNAAHTSDERSTCISVIWRRGTQRHGVGIDCNPPA